MKRDHHAILSLVALGRITPYQAERLLMACNASRDGWWLLACVVLGLLASAAGQQLNLPAWSHAAHAWFGAGMWHHALALIAQGKGEVQ